MGTKNEAGYSQSILDPADINNACLKKLAAFAKALSQGHSSNELVNHMNYLKALATTANASVGATPNVEEGGSGILQVHGQERHPHG